MSYDPTRCHRKEKSALPPQYPYHLKGGLIGIYMYVYVYVHIYIDIDLYIDACVHTSIYTQDVLCNSVCEKL